MDYTKIDYRVRDGVAVIRLNDPDALNATSMRMGEELLHAVGRCRTEARAVLLGAVGRAFCAGANLDSDDLGLDDPARDVGIALERYFNPILTALRDMPLPVVSAVRGAAAGVGCGLALSGDIIVAGDNAFFLQAFRHVGLVPDGGSSYLLGRAIGRVRAMEMMLLGERLSAAKALDWGLITRMVPEETVDDAAFAIAAELAGGPASLGAIKRMAWAALDTPFAAQLDHEREAQREAGRTEDFVEGISAYVGKRAARFAGQ